MTTPLRKCRDCKLEAHTVEDLEQFVKHPPSNHGHMNRCKPCAAKIARQWYRDNR